MDENRISDHEVVVDGSIDSRQLPERYISQAWDMLSATVLENKGIIARKLHQVFREVISRTAEEMAVQDVIPSSETILEENLFFHVGKEDYMPVIEKLCPGTRENDLMARVEDAVEELGGSEEKFIRENGNVDVIPLYGKITVTPLGDIDLYVNKHIIPYFAPEAIGNTDNYKLSMNPIYKFENRYAPKLYEFIVGNMQTPQVKRTGSFRIHFGYFKKLLLVEEGTTNSQARYFNARILKPAAEEVLQKSDIYFDYEPEREKGTRQSAIRFFNIRKINEPASSTEPPVYYEEYGDDGEEDSVEPTGSYVSFFMYCEQIGLSQEQVMMVFQRFNGDLIKLKKQVKIYRESVKNGMKMELYTFLSALSME